MAASCFAGQVPDWTVGRQGEQHNCPGAPANYDEWFMRIMGRAGRTPCSSTACCRMAGCSIAF